MSDAWDLAEACAARAGVVLRPLVTPEDAEEIGRVMRATWGEEEPLPREMVIALAAAGNVPYGAMLGEELVGYVLGWAGITPQDGLHIHSHQLATVSGSQNRGVGYTLKLAQRAAALDAGISLVRWTFDPLISRNAWFNLVKLGTTADRFLLNFYGAMHDEINRGERSDRLLVRWDLDRFEGKPLNAKGQEVLGRTGEDTAPAPGSFREPDGLDAALIRIPRDYHSLRGNDRSLASAWREATSRAFGACFDAGYIVAGFTEDSTYVLTRTPA
jgi:predicted GNAT superfamily acetyltransferase